MDDIERIQEMVAEGRISPEDGERLMAVLRDIDAADFALDSAASQPPAAPEPPSTAVPFVPEQHTTPLTPARPSAASELPEVAAAIPPSAAATEPIERRRERFEAYERRRLERLHRDAVRRQQHAQRELDRIEREAQREADRVSREVDRAQREAERTLQNAQRQVEQRDLSGERERLKEAVRVATQAANEAAREVARRAQEIGKQAASAAQEATQEAVMEATQAARELARQARGGQGAVIADVDLGPSEAVETGTAHAQASEARMAAPASQRAIAPAGTRWVTAEVLAGDINVESVSGITRPEIDGSNGVTVVETDYGYLIKQAPEHGSILDRFLAHVRSGEMKIRIPADHGLNLKATAGDIDLRGVKYLQGRVTAGDIKARGLEGIDFSSMAGEVDVELRLKQGDHSLTCSAGDLNVVLTSDSDVTVDGSVSIGDAHCSHPAIRAERRTLGERLTGTLGSGAASLSLRVTTGELGVKVEDQDRSG